MIGSGTPARWRRSAHIAWVADDERVVVLNLVMPSPQPVALEGAAAAIWNSLDESPASTDEIVGRLANAYGVPADSIRSDVDSFLTALRAEGIAESSTSG